MRMRGSPRKMSSLVSARPDRLFQRTASRSAATSSQPQRRGRPVVAPYSPPASRRRSPSSSVNSVGDGPPPTRAVYALAMPMTLVIAVGPMPAAEHAPAAIVDDEVTYG